MKKILLLLFFITIGTVYSAVTVPFRVNCGGSDYIDPDGFTWAVSQGYSSGSYGALSGAGAYTEGGDCGGQIAGTTNDTVFLSYVYRAGAGDYYQVDVPNGTYDIKLYYAELFGGTSRSWDITINSTPVVTGFNPSGPGICTAETPVVTSYSVSNGQIVVGAANVLGGTQFPFICGIEINSAVTPTFTLTPTNTVPPTSTPTMIPTKVFATSGYTIKRFGPGNDSYGSTPNAYTHSFLQGVCEVGGNIYVGGDLPFINKIDRNTLMISRYAGKSDNSTQFLAGPRSSCIIPDGVTDMCYDSNTNTMFMASYWYNQVWKYDFTNDKFDNFSGVIMDVGNVQGNSLTARYRYPAFCDVKGNTVYVTDRDGYDVVGIDIRTGESHLIAGVPDTAGQVDGVGLKTTCKFQGPKGVAVNSTNSLIYVADGYDIRVIDVAGNSTYTLVTGSPITGICITPDDQYLYYTNAINNIIRRVTIATKTDVQFTYGGGGDNYTDAKVTTTNVKFAQPCNIRVSPDGNRLYVCDTGNRKLKQIDLTTTYATNMHGLGWWSANTQANFTGWTPSCGGIDFWGDRIVVSNPYGNVISMITGNYKEDIAGKPGVNDSTDRAFGTSTVGQIYSGCVSTYLADPYFYFFDSYVMRKVDLNTKYTSFVCGQSNSGYQEGSGINVKIGDRLPHLIAYDKYIYFSDPGNNCIRRLDLDSGNTALVAGIPGDGGNVDGKGLTTTCKFYWPADLVVDKNSNGNIIYTIDSSSGVVSWIDIAGNSKGILTTTVGTIYQYAYNPDQKQHYYGYLAGATATTYFKKLYGSTETTIAGGGHPFGLWVYGDGDALAQAYTNLGYSMKYNDRQKYILFDDLRYLDMSVNSQNKLKYFLYDGF